MDSLVSIYAPNDSKNHFIAILEMIRQEKRFYTSDAPHIAWQKVKIGG